MNPYNPRFWAPFICVRECFSVLLLFIETWSIWFQGCKDSKIFCNLLPKKDFSSSVSLSLSASTFHRLFVVPPAGICTRCGEKVVGEGTGCTAMEQVYHIKCFVCIVCHLQLQGKPFYALDSKPYCEDCYLVSSSPLNEGYAFSVKCKFLLHTNIRVTKLIFLIENILWKSHFTNEKKSLPFKEVILIKTNHW